MIDKVDYHIARNKAVSLKRTGFGKTPAIRDYNLHILSFIELDELTQLVAISFYRSKTESRNFYSILCEEIAQMGLYRNRDKIQVDFDIVDLKDDRHIKQLYNLYRAAGFDLFYKYLHISAPRSTVQKWTWKCFGHRKNEKRLSVKVKRTIKRILETGGVIRFSESTSTVYIFNNEVKLRISDHSGDALVDFDKIQINHVG
jgi:hypothetical protein